MMKWMRIYLLFLMVLAVSTVQAQEPLSLDDVFVTTQDYASLRAGPGTLWDRLAVLPYGETFRAVGRTIDGDWIQIAYEGELAEGARTEFTVNGVTYGWVASWLLIWTGNILELPIDGVVLVPITRAAGPLIVIGPNTIVYEGSAGPSRRVESPASTPVRVEATGRLGGADAVFYWIQFKMQGKYYWMSAGGSSFRNLPDASYLYAYGRLSALLRRESRDARRILNDIRGRWQNLDSGQPVTCNNIPADFNYMGFTESDLHREPLYVPTAQALDEIRLNLNSALSAFRDVCAETARIASADAIQTALDDIRNAERYLNILEDWVIPFQRRDPVLGQSQTRAP